MPRTNVEIAPPCIFPATILIGACFAQVGRHDVQRRVTHGESKSNISNHWCDQISIVSISRSSISWSIDLAVQRGSNSHNAFLPSRSEALTTK
jgi:hypothetical protein